MLMNAIMSRYFEHGCAPWLGPLMGRICCTMQEFESELKNSADDAADEGKKLADDVKSKVDDISK